MERSLPQAYHFNSSHLKTGNYSWICAFNCNSKSIKDEVILNALFVVVFVFLDSFIGKKSKHDYSLGNIK